MNTPDYTTPLLSVEGLGITFSIHGGHLEVVRNASFDVPRGRTVALVGESGSGKSVTAQAIMRILPDIATISSGRIELASGDNDPVRIDRLDPRDKEMRRIRGARISMIFQEPMVSLSPVHTIGDQISEALFLHREVDRREGMEQTAQMLDMVGFPNPRRALKTYPFELSGGLRQRAMIAMALICRPDLLIADEPTTALDVTIQAQILKLIKDLQQEFGMSVLLITHDLGVVANMADQVVVMYHGEIMERGAVEDVFRNPGHVYLKALFDAVPHFDMKPGERLKPLREIKVTTTSDLPAAGGGHVNIIEARGLTRSFTIRKSGLISTASDTMLAVDDVSFDVRRGECFGLVGESGCGKTTLSKLLMHAIRSDKGKILFYDGFQAVDVLELNDEDLQKFRRRQQYIFQDPNSSLSPRMTVFDIIREPLQIHGLGDDRQQVEWVKELMHRVGLDPRFLNRYPHSFSGGQRQRIGIARALALQPEMIICDEPVSALDVSIQAQVLNLLKDLKDRLNLTYMFISHNLAVVDYIADRIAVMCAGRIVEIAPRETLFRNPAHPYTATLIAAVPYPELDRPLDFQSVMDSRLSDPGAWPAPFTVKPGAASSLVEIEPDHFVRHGKVTEEAAA